jgi:hypothetical protein
MIDLLFPVLRDFWPYIAGAFGILVAYFTGRSNAKKDSKIDDMENALDIRRRADEALRNFDGDTRPIDDRLRDLGRLRD